MNSVVSSILASFMAPSTFPALDRCVPYSRVELSKFSKACGMKRRQYVKLWRSGRLPPHCSSPGTAYFDAVESALSAVLPLFSVCYGITAIKRSFQQSGVEA